MLGIVLTVVFVVLLGIMALEAYIISPKRIQDANQILYEINKTHSDYERHEMRTAYDEIMDEERKTTFILITLFMLDIVINLAYIIIYKPFD